MKVARKNILKLIVVIYNIKCNYGWRKVLQYIQYKYIWRKIRTVLFIKKKNILPFEPYDFFEIVIMLRDHIRQLSVLVWFVPALSQQQWTLQFYQHQHFMERKRKSKLNERKLYSVLETSTRSMNDEAQINNRLLFNKQITFFRACALCRVIDHRWHHSV